MTEKRRVGRQDLKAVLLVTLALMLQMDGQMDAAYAGQQMPGSSPVLEEEMLYITRKLDAGPELAGAGKAVGQAEDTGAGTAVGQVAGTQTGLEVPSGSYWDRNGREYVLDHYEVKEVPGHMVSRVLEKQVVYSDVEGAEGLPESITVTEEVSGIPAEGELYIRDSRIVREEWRDGFQAPVLFHSYGADEYQTGSLVISGEDVLASAVESQKGLLEVMGLSLHQNRIHSMVCEGEAFEDEEGQL